MGASQRPGTRERQILQFCRQIETRSSPDGEILVAVIAHCPVAGFSRGVLVLLVAVLASGRYARADSQWEHVRSDDGITTWVRARGGEDLPLFRSRAEMHVPVWQLLAVLEDVDHACEWTAHCVQMRRVERFGERDLVVYARMDAPWPVRDRDVVTRVRVLFGTPGELTISIRKAGDAWRPRRDAVVRMPAFAASYRFEMLGQERTRVTYEASIDPGGSLPDWLKRMLARSFPHETLMRLRDRVTDCRERGTYAQRAAELEASARRDGFRPYERPSDALDPERLAHAE